MTPWNLRGAYLDLLINALTDTNHSATSSVGGGQGLSLTNLTPDHLRWIGEDLPALAETLIGVRRLTALRTLIEKMLDQNVPGDIAICGAWRGGPAILAAAILAAYGITDRNIYVCDSFKGPPPPNPEKYPADDNATFHTVAYLAVPVDEVKFSFLRYGIPLDHVHFIEGYFRDTLPSLSDRTWALIYLDGVMYESTMDVLVNLYDNLSPRGCLYIDRYLRVGPPCTAVNDFRVQRNIAIPMHPIAVSAAYWCKP